MQQNSITCIDKIGNTDDRYSSIDISGVPKWLEDMSNKMQRSKSVSDHKDYYTKIYMEMNNNADKINGIKLDIPINSPVSSRNNSAKHGRRADMSSSSSISTPNEIDEDDYSVPNIQNLKMKDKLQTNEQYYEKLIGNPNSSYKFRNNDKNPKPNYSFAKNSTSEPISYSPSILEKDNGRRSRVDILDETFNDLISTITDTSISSKNPKSKTVPEFQKYNLENLVNTDPKEKQKTTLDNKNSDKESILKLSTENNESSKAIFDEIYKNKIQKNVSRKFAYSPNKRMRYRKFKYKQGSAITSKKDGKQIDLSKFAKDLKSENIIEEEIFIIPELPSGSKMLINIFSTWGDKYYVGLNGIEIFGSDGNIIQVKKIDAPDINILPDCVNDPRIVSNLLDGVNRTHDDLHLWLAPFEVDKEHIINVEFEKYTQLAMMRIWNYNKSRIHSYRGARYIVITLDDVPIFKGEIAQACGSINGSIESFGDTILFTTDESILEKISRNDEAFTTLMSTTNSDSADKIDRPLTANQPDEPKQRPYTHAFAKIPQEETGRVIGTHRIDLVFILNWGKPDLIGLTGLEIIGESDTAISLNAANISSNHKGSVKRLIDDENLTNDPKHMWLVNYNSDNNVILSIKFDTCTYVSGIRLWNYNENIENTFAGVRIMNIFLDNKLIDNPLTNDSTFILRRAPGNIHYDYVQEIQFIIQSESTTTEAIYDFSAISKYREESFEQPNMPEGFVFQIVIYTTWGDQYYVGLNGIEIYDHLGRMILLSENNICAHPESVNVLPAISGDIRTPDKLINGINEEKDGSNSWLAPVIPKCLNRIYIVLDQPVSISVIKLWNYFKTPARGVKEFGILVDDLLVYNGILDKSTEKSSVKYRSILFTSNADVIRKEIATLVKHNIDSQGTVLTNDKLRMTTGGSLPGVDQSLRPFTSVNHLYRGRTSLSN